MRELLIKLRNYLLKEETVEDCPEQWKRIACLCHAIELMYNDNLIDTHQASLLKEYIIKHKPKWYQKHYSFSIRNIGYYWGVGLWLPRILWLNDQIYKLK
jgi:hypothetical protein